MSGLRQSCTFRSLNFYLFHLLRHKSLLLFYFDALLVIFIASMSIPMSVTLVVSSPAVLLDDDPTFMTR